MVRFAGRCTACPVILAACGVAQTREPVNTVTISGGQALIIGGQGSPDSGPAAINLSGEINGAHYDVTPDHRFT